MLKFLPKDVTFFELLEASAARAEAAIEELQRLVGGDAAAATALRERRRAEHRREGPTYTLIDKLNGTFLTPLDREDLHDLAFRLDDILDAILIAADRVTLYRIDAYAGSVPQLLGLLQATQAPLQAGLAALRSPQTHSVALEQARVLHGLGLQADELHHEALAQLYAIPMESPQLVLEAIKLKEIYDQLKRALDAAEDVADILHGIVIKNA
ncbi:MAG: DUF47 family protein [Candidatus Sericytochromatia bacterium]|nr:DUF47 family protein [Candidatus Sericytochromatia bacterium]